MCKIVSFEDVREELIQHYKRNMLIPVIGSGFTRGCTARKGRVPSGADYKQYMIEKIVSYQSDIEQEELEQESFSGISTIYHEVVPKAERQRYLRESFSQVHLSDDKKAILDANWQYIYTLNIDDAIERNSKFDTPIISNREVRSDIFDHQKCVIKLHGDVKDMIVYEDSDCEIFDQKQYVVSIQKNKSLLNKLTHDYEFLNLIFIGCSLSDEIDVLFSWAEAGNNNNSRYYCTNKKPSKIEEIKLYNYGITHCIIFDSYDEIYGKIKQIHDEAMRIVPVELNSFIIHNFQDETSGFEVNAEYLFHGKNLLNNNRIVRYPNFFISRDVTDGVIQNISKKSTIILLGRGCSGKSYILFDVVKRVRDRDVYAFQTKERLNDESLKQLIENRNCLTIVDSQTLTIEQIEEVIKTDKERCGRNNCFLIAESKSNRELFALITLLELQDKINKEELYIIDISHELSKKETDHINAGLLKSTLGVFHEGRSIADNIINASNILIHENRFSNSIPSSKTIKEIASLIVLATKGKVFSMDVINLDLYKEFELQETKTAPLIEKETTFLFETSAANNSPFKYVINAKYWLNEQLNIIATSHHGIERIVEAYYYIVCKLVENSKSLLLPTGKKRELYKDYILFDNINTIFIGENSFLITKIYEKLNDLLAEDPNYMHQRAKCYIRSAYSEKDEKEKKEWLSRAFRDASVSSEVFEKRYGETKNEKVKISADHSLYTAAIALCQMSFAFEYKNIELNSKAIQYLYSALISPYNSFDYFKKDNVYNYGNAGNNLIKVATQDTALLKSKEDRKKLSELFKMSITN